MLRSQAVGGWQVPGTPNRFLISGLGKTQPESANDVLEHVDIGFLADDGSKLPSHRSPSPEFPRSAFWRSRELHMSLGASDRESLWMNSSHAGEPRPAARLLFRPKGWRHNVRPLKINLRSHGPGRS